LYKKVDDAEDAYNINYFDADDASDTVNPATPLSSKYVERTGLSPMFQHSPLRKGKADVHIPWKFGSAAL